MCWNYIDDSISRYYGFFISCFGISYVYYKFEGPKISSLSFHYWNDWTIRYSFDQKSFLKYQPDPG